MIESADDIIAALRSIIADYEQRPQEPIPPVGRAAPGNPSPPDPPGAATSASVEDSARRAAMRGRQYFLDWYGKRSDADRKRVQAIAGEIKALFPAAIAKAKGE